MITKRRGEENLAVACTCSFGARGSKVREHSRRAHVQVARTGSRGHLVDAYESDVRTCSRCLLMEISSVQPDETNASPP